MMDRLTLSRIDEQLDSSEVAALCFLCQDVVNRKRLAGIEDAKGLFMKLEEKRLLENHLFLSDLLKTIRRADLVSLLSDGRPTEESDANPTLSLYRVMLYRLYEDMTQENLDKLKFLLSNKLGRRQTELCKTALDVFTEMEKTGLVSNVNVNELYVALQELDQELAFRVNDYMQGINQIPGATSPHISLDYQSVNNNPQPTQAAPYVSETQPREPSVYTDAEPNKPSPLLNERDYYAMNNNPHGVCMIINNENFTELRKRLGTQKDEDTLSSVFTKFGFKVEVHNNLTAEAIREQLTQLSRRNFLMDDALVVCVLSHGHKDCVFGTDDKMVLLRELTQPFRSGQAPTLVGKPKLFFIQACQGDAYQRGSVPCPPRPSPKNENTKDKLEEDAGPVKSETIPHDADFLLGMATVEDCKSFRNVYTGSIYIQELCKQLMMSAQSSEMDDILTVLTRVNREVSKGEYLKSKQMPEPKYTLTKKVVFRCVEPTETKCNALNVPESNRP